VVYYFGSCKDAQISDKIVGIVYKLKNAKTHKPTWNEISKYPPDLKSYWFSWDQLEIQNGILYRKYKHEVTKQTIKQLVLPFALRHDILTELHGGKTAGHLGEHKTLAKVRMRFFWHGQKHHIIDFCKKCNLCAQKKPPHIRNKAQLQQYVVGAPLESFT
jgi:hypothetical protein